MSKKVHHHVAFAAQHSNARFPTFNAWSAIYRLRLLKDDINELSSLKDQAEAADIRFGSWLSAYEIINYYLVGFVTCLEWHARSRIADLLMFAPHLVERADIEKIHKLALTQMMSEKVTIPHLIGAANAVSSASEYLDIFDRVLDGIKQGRSARKVLGPLSLTVTDAGSTSKIPAIRFLNDLFSSRNALVHEIDLAVIGHASIRGLWDLAEVKSFADAVEQCMMAIEAEVAAHSPGHFPNRVDADGHPEDELGKLRKAIADAEVQIEKRSEGWVNDDGVWRAAVAANAHYIAAEEAFLDASEFLAPIRHLDFREGFKVRLLQLRLSYLNSVMEEMPDAVQEGQEPDEG